MGAVAHLPNQVEPARSDASLTDLVSTCSDIIGSAFAERIRQLGGTDSDIRQLSTSAAYAVFAWSAGRVLSA
ncbi:MAG: hypothetical protein P4L86_02845 [Mycobacterium sp.]|nr:hypothetical protein [Mycobacterium sp.]